jgi:ankyrin repeat protein
MAKFPTDIESKFWSAAKQGDLPALQDLLKKHGALADHTFSQAASESQTQVLEFLFRQCRKEIKEQEMVHSLAPALRNKRLEVVNLILDSGMLLDQPLDLLKNSALTIAAEQGLAGVAQKLIGAGANLNYQNTSLVASMQGQVTGQTALMIAAAKGRVEIVKALIKGGADVNAVGENGKTALDFAGKSAKNEVVRQLLLNADAKSGKEFKGVTKLEKAHKVGARVVKGCSSVSTFDAACRLLEDRCGEKVQAYPSAKGVWFCHYKAGGPVGGKAYVKTLEPVMHFE